MQVANEQTVLGDFNDAEFTHFGVTSTFYKKDGGFHVRTDGPDGELQDYEVKYTFGVTPLQQYLIEFPGGRLQVLRISWDSRPALQGGQRWFQLYGDEVIPHDDEFHWTGPSQNWNFMCAECHSTNVRMNYDLESGWYETTFSEINVSCEACHGPGSNHVAWAEELDRGDTLASMEGMGLQVSLADPDGGTWVFDPDATIARRSTPLRSRVQVESCARCHSRRSVLSEDYVHGRPLMDTHVPAALEEGLYYADGQILDEVYVYGSFLQSKMYDRGVRCSDCHEPHSLNLIATGNSLCGRCHVPESFDTPRHHFHEPGSPGANCVDCHMPARTYMEIDPRRDHSFRIPRPDLSVSLGTPDVCTRCHDDRPVQWAADTVREWYDPKIGQSPHYAEALHAGRTGGPEAEQALSKLAMDGEYPAIVRASALGLLGGFPGPSTSRAIAMGVVDEDPLVRLAAFDAMEFAAPDERPAVAHELLRDPVRAIRIEAARVLSPLRSEMTEAQREIFDPVADEYIAAQLANGDRPWAHIDLALHYLQVGNLAEAESSYRAAIRLDPSSVEAYVNLADVYRLQQRDDRGEEILREALRGNPGFAEVHHVLGLLLVRTGRPSEAVPSLQAAATLAPGDPGIAFIYGLGLQATGQMDGALAVFERAHERHPDDRDILMKLATIHRDRGNRNAALRFARALLALAPDDPDYIRLLNELEYDRSTAG
jgi:Tfp pilus assembly protein PilF